MNPSSIKSTSIHSSSASTILSSHHHDANKHKQRKDTPSTSSSTVPAVVSDDDLPAHEGEPTTTKSLPRMRKSKFTVTEAEPSIYNATTPTCSSHSHTSPSSNKTDALSISFLSKAVQDDHYPPKQVIQKALTSLRPGGVFFVLDYKDQDPKEETPSSSHDLVAEENDNSKAPVSPQACSLAMRDIPDELMQKYQLTLVPTNVETFYNTQLVTATGDADWAKPAPVRTSVLPSSQRVIRWMGVKPPVPSQPQQHPVMKL